MSSLALAELPYIKETASTALRQIITTHTFTLPLCLVIGSALWLLPEVGNILLWGGWLVAIVTALFYAELNTKEGLLRKRSQMVSIVCFALLVVCPLWHNGNGTSLVPLLLLCAYYCMINTLQASRPEGYCFYSYVFLSCASLLLPQTVWLVPAMVWNHAAYMRSLTLRSLVASALGFVVPGVMLALYFFCLKGESDFLPRITHCFAQSTDVNLDDWQQLLSIAPREWSVSDWQFLSTFVGLLGIGVVSIVHFLYTSLKDKLRVRMFYNMLLSAELALLLCVLLFPHQRESLLMLLSVNSAPLVAHYFTLANGWLAQVVFYFSLIIYISLIIFNYNTQWILSLVFS